MKKNDLIRFLDLTKIFMTIIFILLVLFYLIIVLPEYLACINCNTEGAMGKDIWGYEVQCFGESRDIGESFFQFISFLTGSFFVVLIIVYYFIFHLKNSLKKYKI